MSSKPKRLYNPYKRYCCVNGCLNKSNSESKLTFFKIPHDIERRKEWFKAIDREDLLAENKLKKAKDNYVCSTHFDDSAIITTTLKRLKCDATPTKLLPHKSQKNIQSDARDDKTSTQALPQTSKDISSRLQKPKNKDKVSVSTYSHTQSQTDTQEQTEIKSEIAQRNINKSSNELNPTSTVLSEPSTSTSQSHTKVRIVANKKPNVTFTSIQTDLIETSNKKTQTALAVSNKSPRKRKLKKELVTVKSKRRRLEQELLRNKKELKAKNSPVTKQSSSTI